MPSPNRPARLNRTLLVLIGLVVLVGGVFVIALDAGLLALWPRTAPVLPSVPSAGGWVPWAAAVVAILIGLLCLRWLLAQTIRRPKTGTWTLTEDPARGATTIDADTGVAPLVAEIETYPGVHNASARLSGSRTQPVLHLVVGTEDGADITELRERIDTEALPRLRQALDLDALPADVLLRLDQARTGRV